MEELETYIKYDNRWIFVGWHNPSTDMASNFILSENQSRGFIYRTVKWLDGKVEEYKYRLPKM